MRPILISSSSSFSIFFYHHINLITLGTIYEFLACVLLLSGSKFLVYFSTSTAHKHSFEYSYTRVIESAEKSEY